MVTSPTSPASSTPAAFSTVSSALSSLILFDHLGLDGGYWNPWPANPAANADTHLVDSGNDLGIDLAALDAHTSRSPVWRLMVYKDGGPNKDPDSPDRDYRPEG